MTVEVELLAPADLELWAAMGRAAPRWSSSPTPGARHELDACRLTAAMLGTPLLPWQEWIVRLATERRTDDPRRYRFPLFLLTVPRQAGKTTVVRVILLTRAILYADRRAYYTAQTGKDATERWADLASAVMARSCPLRPLVTLRKAAGSARLTLTPTGSRIAPFAPTPESLHGYTPHDVAVDELFAFDDAEGIDLEGAIVPAQLTLPDRQLLMLSTAGSRESTYLRRKVDEGRAAASSPDASSGYAEWSLPPNLDPYDPESWHFHPAYGLTQHREDFEIAAGLRGEGGLPPGEWLRAMMNVWTESADPLFDMAAYDATRVPRLDPVPLSGAVVGVGVSHDRARAALVAAWPLELDGEQRIAVKLLRTLPAGDVPVAALVDELLELARAPQDDRPQLYGAGPSTQTRSVLDDVRRAVAPVVDTAQARADRRVVELDSREWTLASTQLHAAISDGTLAHELDEGAAPLRAGVDRALARPGRDGTAWQLAPTSPPETLALAAALRGVRVKTDAPVIKIRG